MPERTYDVGEEMIQPDPLAAELRHRRVPSRRAQSILGRSQIVAERPHSAVAEHNLAAALGDVGFWRAAERHIRAAFAKGGDAPETWLVLARALVENSRWVEAERAFEQALARRPLYYDAVKELAQLRWMLSGDLAAALSDIDARLRHLPDHAPLRLLRAQVLDNADQKAEAYEDLLALARGGANDPSVLTALAQTSLELGAFGESLRFSEIALAVAPDAPATAIAFANACFAAGAAERALAPIERLRQQHPESQHAIALQATAWRILGDPRYRALYDFDAFVGAFPLDAPAGWDSLAAYVVDLAAALDAAHTAKTHPFNQSIKNGTQAGGILDSNHRALRALPTALDAPIRAYLERLGQGQDALRARNTGRFAIHGVWSIRMRSGGAHINHVHSEGWISSACHIVIPQASSPREGWLKFGEPGTPMRTPYPPEHYVQPQAGRIVLFPSYMWHGSTPFAGEGVRLTFALDVVPD